MNGNYIDMDLSNTKFGDKLITEGGEIVLLLHNLKEKDEFTIVKETGQAYRVNTQGQCKNWGGHTSKDNIIDIL